MVTVSAPARPAPHAPQPVPVAALPLPAGLLDGEAAGLIVAAGSDLSLVVDADGVIREAASGGEDPGPGTVAAWRGRPFSDTVTVESRPKVEALLREARADAVTRWRQVNHPSPEGPDLPVRYAALRPKAGGPVILVGRNLRAVAALQHRLAEAQQALERDYDRQRAAETRYRLLFQLSNEPVLVIDAGTRRIAEVNPAAARLFGRQPKRLAGLDAVDLFEAGSARAVETLFATLRVAGEAADILARLAHGRGATTVSASLFRGESATSVLLRLAVPAEGEAAQGLAAHAAEVLRAMPEGFVVTDAGRRVLAANTAFLELSQLATEEQARGQPLDAWLGHDETEAQALFATLRDHGSVRRFSTVLRGQYGSVEDVEVAAVAVPGQGCLGFSFRAGPRRATSPAGTALPRSVEQMTELVGRVSMKTLVRETTDLIEKLCIEAALRITRDNRASAAEMLGLSRQGLYAKMRRYGIGDLDGPDEA